MTSFSITLEESLQRSIDFAAQNKHEHVTIEHLLISLLDDKDAYKVLIASSVDVDLLKSELTDFINKQDYLIVDNDGVPEPTAGYRTVVTRAAIHVQQSGGQEVDGGNVIVAIFSQQESYSVYLLEKQDMTRYDAVQFLAHGIKKNQTFGDIQPDREEVEYDDEDSPLSKDSALDSFCENLNEKAKNQLIDPLIGRASEVNRLIQILSRRRKNNPLLVGDPGVGKTAIAEGLAFRIVENDVPDIISKTVIFSLDMGSILAGTRYRGDFEERIKAVLKEIEDSEDAVLFIDEIHTVIGAGATSGGSMDASNLLKPSLQGQKLRCIGSTTYKEYRQFFDKDRALSRRFQKIDVEEPSIPDTIKILIGLNPILISFFTSHSGLLRFETPRKYLPKTYSQLFPSSFIIHLIGLSKSEDFIFSIFKFFNVPQPLAARSRAIPLTLKQSPLLGVIATSKIGSFKLRAVTASVPSTIFSEISIIPSCSSLNPSSLSESIIPSDISPLILPFFSVKSIPGI